MRITNFITCGTLPIKCSSQALFLGSQCEQLVSLCASAPRIWYASLFANPRGRYQPSRANSKISHKVGNWYASPPPRRETAAATNLADLITAFKIFTGLLDIDPNLFFLPPARRGLRGHTYKVLQGVSHHQRRGLAFSVRVVKY